MACAQTYVLTGSLVQSTLISSRINLANGTMFWPAEAGWREHVCVVTDNLYQLLRETPKPIPNRGMKAG